MSCGRAGCFEGWVETPTGMAPCACRLARRAALRANLPARTMEGSDYRDVCAARHGGNEQSNDANRRAAKGKASDRERIALFVAHSGHHGTTLRQIAELFGRHPNEISGRITELKQAERIWNSGRVRDGCAVLVGRKEWVNGG